MFTLTADKWAMKALLGGGGQNYCHIYCPYPYENSIESICQICWHILLWNSTHDIAYLVFIIACLVFKHEIIVLSDQSTHKFIYTYNTFTNGNIFQWQGSFWYKFYIKIPCLQFGVLEIHVHTWYMYVWHLELSIYYISLNLASF